MAQYGVKEVMDMVISTYNAVPHKREPLIVLDYAQMTEIDNAAERTDISGGRGNARLLSFDHSKTTEINLTLPLVDMQLLSIISGDCFMERTSELFKQYIAVPVDNEGVYEIELPHDFVEGSVYANVLEGNRDLGEKLEVKADETELEPNAKLITLSGNGILDENGSIKEVIVHYHTVTSSPTAKLTINPTKFPQAISLYGETLFRNQFTEEDEVYHVVAHKGRIRPEYTLSMDATDAAVLELTIDLYAYTDQDTREEIYLEYIKSEEEASTNPCEGIESK